MKGITTLLLAGLAAAVPPPPASPHHRGCTSATIAADAAINGSVPLDLSPLTHFSNTTLKEINSTTWEYWYMDGVSDDGDAAVTLVFFRDPSLLYLGLGALRVSVDAVWANGTRYNTMIFPNSSVVTDCEYGPLGWENTGNWTGGACTDCSFKTVGDRAIAVQISGTGYEGRFVSGTFELQSCTHPRYPGGELYPSEHASLELAPLIYWNEAIPAGRVKTSFTLGGTELSFSGYGGLDRIWAAYNWDSLADHWWWVRIITGPYSAVIWKYYSPLSNRYHVFGYLEEAGTVLVRASQEAPGNRSDWTTFQLKHDTDGVHGTFPDNNTGFIVDLHSAATGQVWRFDVNHTNIVFESPAVSNDQYSRFSNVAKGGRVGGVQFPGVAKSEQNVIKSVVPIL